MDGVNHELADNTRLYFDGDRTLNGFRVQHSETLRAERTMDTRGDRNDPFCMWWTDEVLQQIGGRRKLGFLRDLVEEDIGYLNYDRFGKRSVDPLSHEREMRILRSINRASCKLSEMIGKPVVIKGKGSDMYHGNDRREDYVNKFELMRSLELKNKRLLMDLEKRGVDCSIRFLGVFGVFSYAESLWGVDGTIQEKLRQWLFMEEVVGACQVENISVARVRFGGRGSSVENGFSADEHPQLANLVWEATHSERNVNFVSWDCMSEALQILGCDKYRDVAARNTLFTIGEDGRKSYVLIDP